MGTYAVVRDGKVENTIVWDGEDTSIIPTGTDAIEINDETGPASIGWDFDGEKFVNPNPDDLSGGEEASDEEEGGEGSAA